jgi:hypothetical protein
MMIPDLQGAKFTLSDRLPGFAKKLAPVFKLNNWTWKGGVPSEDDISLELDMLLQGAYLQAKKDGNYSSLSAGRLQVRFVKTIDTWIGYMELVSNHVMASSSRSE